MGKAIYLVKNRHLEHSMYKRVIPERELAVAVQSLDLQRARVVAPDTLWFVYANAESVPGYGSTESMYGQHRAAMAAHVVDIDDGYGSQQLALTFDAYHAQAEWLRMNMAPLGFDGVYVDQAFTRPPLRWLAARASLTGLDHDELLRRWVLLRDHFLAKLRRDFDVPVIANVGAGPGEITHEVDGFTIESKPGGWGMPSILAVREFMRRPSPYNVSWYSGLEAEGLALNGQVIPE